MNKKVVKLNRSDIEVYIQKQVPQLSNNQVKLSIDLLINQIVESVSMGDKVEIRGFGTISRKINKEKFVRNPKTNQKLFKNQSYKLHFKIGKILHKKINHTSEFYKEDDI